MDHEAMLAEIIALRKDLKSHIDTETPLFLLLRESLQELGSADEVRTRRIFIESWMARERDRAALRKAVIEKTMVAAIWAVLVFVVIAVGHDIRDVVREWTGK